LRTVANTTDVKDIITEALLNIVPGATDITIEKAQKLFTGTWSAVATYTLGADKMRSQWFIDKEGNSQLVDTTTLGPAG
jgi:hypothetical protein